MELKDELEVEKLVDRLYKMRRREVAVKTWFM
jgi:hypothetical protein